MTDSNNKSNAEARAEGVLQNVVDGIGNMVWWKFHGTKITPADLRVHLSNAGLNPDDVADINPIRALKSAVKEFKAWEVVDVPSGFDANGDVVVKTAKKRIRAEVVFENDKELTVALFRHEQKAARKASKEQFDSLSWDKTRDGWYDQGTTDHAVNIITRVLDNQTYLRGSHVRDIVVMPMFRSTGSVCINNGWYCVPNSGSEALEKAKSAVANIETFEIVAPVLPKGMGWETPVQDSVEGQMTSSLETLMEQIDGWENMSQIVGHSTRERVMEKFDSLHTMAESYEAALSVSLDDLRDKIDAMREKAAEVIESKDAEKEEATATARATVRAPQEPVDRRVTLRRMERPSLDRMWAMFGDGGEAPTDTEAMIEAIAEAMAS